MADIFISYKSTEQPAVAKIAEGLRNAGYAVWWDHALLGGQDYSEVITAEIAAAKIVMPIWSKQSVASNWVRAEADAGARKLFPVMIDAVTPPLPFNKVHTLDLVDWDGDYNDVRWQRLQSDLSAVLRGEKPANAPLIVRRGNSAWRWAAAAAAVLVVAASAYMLTRPREAQPPQVVAQAPVQADPFVRALTALRSQSAPIEVALCAADGSACGKQVVRVGDIVRIRVRAPIGGRLILIDEAADGAQTQIYPNGLTPAGAEEAVTANAESLLPSAAHGFDYEIAEPLGRSTLRAIIVPAQSALAPVVETNRRSRGIQVIPQTARGDVLEATQTALNQFGAAQVAFGELSYNVQAAE